MTVVCAEYNFELASVAVLTSSSVVMLVNSSITATVDVVMARCVFDGNAATGFTNSFQLLPEDVEGMSFNVIVDNCTYSHNIGTGDMRLRAHEG